MKILSKKNYKYTTTMKRLKAERKYIKMIKGSYVWKAKL